MTETEKRVLIIKLSTAEEIIGYVNLETEGNETTIFIEQPFQIIYYVRPGYRAPGIKMVRFTPISDTQIIMINCSHIVSTYVPEPPFVKHYEEAVKEAIEQEQPLTEEAKKKYKQDALATYLKEYQPEKPTIN